MVHPGTELRYINETMGWGVFATRPIPKGTITWVRDDFDQTFAPDEVKRMETAYQKILEEYSFVDARGMIVLCWDHSRYFNHSCAANCLSAGYDFELAVRNIRAGEELTDDYGTLNLRQDFHCACGLASCRKIILPDDMERLSEEWDAAVREAFPLISAVQQPLWPLLKEKDEVEHALKSPAELRSIRCNYAPEKNGWSNPDRILVG
jgi:hypothetical protein